MLPQAPQPLSDRERRQAMALARQLIRQIGGNLEDGDLKSLREPLRLSLQQPGRDRDAFGIPYVIRVLSTAVLICEKLSPDRNMVMAVLIFRLCRSGAVNPDEVAARWGADIAKMVAGLIKVDNLYDKTPAVVTDNFRKLLLTLADDIRVIIIMIIARLSLMKMINHHPDEESVKRVAFEARYLYSQLAHRLGLYAIKSELEDMSLKYTERATYTRIAHELNATKVARDTYIADFIKPVKERLEREGLIFDIKGRTKSIYSIWNKMKKQNNDLEHIYDLFAIRIILDSTPEREKSDCWMVYSLITDMYQPNPSRMKDWLSIPKSNGYESLHITVRGPEGKWVEVQIRTRRMDEIAEKGLAAHWKYKGVKAEENLDAWMKNVRDIIEAAESGPMELMRNLKMDVYDKEVFIFTPKGDLYQLPLGATVLDFAFHIHSKLGCTCTGARVNGKHQKINYRLQSGDTVEVITSSSQSPKQDWLNFVVTSKARTKIRQTLKEQGRAEADLGKEQLARRCKNRKLDLDESRLMRLIKKLGYKNATDFYIAIASGKLDVADIIERYLEIERQDESPEALQSAGDFELRPPKEENDLPSSDVLVIGQGLKGLNYKLARCCNPIYGDEVFGFVSAEGVIKVHRSDCPNAANIRQKYPYRLIRTRWSGKLGGQFAATIRVLGKDDIGIVTNISSLINKEKDCTLRSIAIDSNDGLFQGYIVVGVNDTSSLNNLIKKIQNIKGVKDVQRSK